MWTQSTKRSYFLRVKSLVFRESRIPNISEIEFSEIGTLGIPEMYLSECAVLICFQIYSIFSI